MLSSSSLYSATRPPQRRSRTAGRRASLAVAASARPTVEESARSLVDIADSGTLCSLTADGWPLGTRTSFLTDPSGQPLLRLRATSHAAQQLQADARCTLYVQPFAQPSDLLSRATLLGSAQALAADEDARVRQLFAAAHGPSTHSGVDAPRDDDLFLRLAVDRVFFVGGLGSVRCAGSARDASLNPKQDAQAEVVSGEAYRAAAADPLRKLAPQLVRLMNDERVEDVRLFCESGGVAGAAQVRMLWLDRLGFDVRASLADGEVKDVRITWRRPVEKEQDALSQLTLLAQQLWEESSSGRAYKPAPVLAPSPA